MENNVGERTICPMTTGRKNWLFIGSMNAGKSAATIMSLIQACRRMRINPSDYLCDVISKLPGLHEEHYHTLLPQNWKK
jgi:transposase